MHLSTPWTRWPRAAALGALLVLLACSSLFVAAGVAAATTPTRSAASLPPGPGSLLWAKVIKQAVSRQDDEVLWVKRGPKGTVYAGGNFNQSQGRGSLFVARFTAEGKQLWLRKYGQAQGVGAHGNVMTVDATGNVIIAGVSAHGSDARLLVLKYSPAGRSLWHCEWNGPVVDGYDAANAVACDVAGNVVLGGVTTQAASGKDYLVVKFDAAGHRRWTYHAAGQAMPPTQDDAVEAVATDRNGSIYLTGAMRDAMGIAQCVTQKIGANGKLKWKHGASGDSRGLKIAVAAGKVHVMGTVMSGPANQFCCLVTCGLDGAGGTWLTVGWGGAATPTDLAIAADGSVWICGFYAWSSDPSKSNAFIGRYDASGGHQTGAFVHNSGQDSTRFNAITVDAHGSAWAVGDVTASSGHRLIVVKCKVPQSGQALTRDWTSLYPGQGSGASGTCVTIAGTSPSLFIGGWRGDAAAGPDAFLARYVK